MAIAIAKLATFLTCNSSHFNKNIRKSGKESKRFRSEAHKTNKALKTMGKMFGAAAVAAGAMRLGRVLYAEIQVMDRLAKTATKLGMTAEALAGLQHAATLTGVATNTLDMAIQRMTRRLAEAAMGTGEAKGAIIELGLSAKRLSAMGANRAFAEIAEAMKNVSSQADRVRLSFKLFDSEGVALVNTLRLGASGLREATKEAKEFGLAMSEDAARNIEMVSDAITRLEARWTGLKRSMASSLGKTFVPEESKMLTVADLTGTTAERLQQATSALEKWSNKLKGYQQEVKQFPRYDALRSSLSTIYLRELQFKALNRDLSITESHLKNVRSLIFLLRMELDLGIDRKPKAPGLFTGIASAAIENRKAIMAQLSKAIHAVRMKAAGAEPYDLFGTIGDALDLGGIVAKRLLRDASNLGERVGKAIAAGVKRLTDKPQGWKAIGDAMRASTRTPMEEYTRAIDEAGVALGKHAIGWETYGRLIRDAKGALESASRTDTARVQLPTAIREGSTAAAIAAYEAANPTVQNIAVTTRLDRANEYARDARDSLEEIVVNTGGMTVGSFAP